MRDVHVICIYISKVMVGLHIKLYQKKKIIIPQSLLLYLYNSKLYFVITDHVIRNVHAF